MREIKIFAEGLGQAHDHVLVLGIGGSALGNTALQTALNSPYHNLHAPAGLPRLFVLDNIDPDLVAEFLDRRSGDDALQRHLEVRRRPPRR